MADTTIEIQGYKILCVDNGDGTFSLATTTTNSGTQTLEEEGVRLRISPTGGTDPVSGKPLFALMTT